MPTMPRSSKEKVKYAKELIEKDLSYDEIQSQLFDRFGSGMSNSTIKKMSEKKENINDLKAQNEELKRDLQLFKRLYFDLLEKTEKKKKTL